MESENESIMNKVVKSLIERRSLNNLDDNTANNGIDDTQNSKIIDTSNSYTNDDENEKCSNIAQQISEEFKIWTVNTLVLYDLVMSHTTEWPSLTVQFLPSLESVNDEAKQKLCIGTHTSNNEPNFLLILDVNLPTKKLPTSQKRYESLLDYEGFTFGENTKKFKISARIPHCGEVNRAAYLPSKPSIIATKGASNDVYIFDSSRFGAEVIQKQDVKEHAEMILRGHKSEGWGLSWNEDRPGLLSSVSDDGILNIWDINHDPVENNRSDPLFTVVAYNVAAQDVTWQKGSEGSGNIILTVGDDGILKLWDMRVNCSQRPCQKMALSRKPLNTLSSNLLRSNIIALGGCDQQIYLADSRRMDGPLHRMSSHNDSIVRIHWSGFKCGLLASASSDRFISLWDIERVGMELQAEDLDDGPPELIFTHGGHVAAVSDFHWNCEKEYQWMIASISEDNVLQIWTPSSKAFEDMENEVTDSDISSDDDEFSVE